MRVLFEKPGVLLLAMPSGGGEEGFGSSPLTSELRCEVGRGWRGFGVHEVPAEPPLNVDVGLRNDTEWCLVFDRFGGELARVCLRAISIRLVKSSFCHVNCKLLSNKDSSTK